ncbi:hypothetical protein SLS56_003121 [Neofusicoccum ribis]|uniref:Amidohydrolase-related domain-containing protein n=1 Tax=Neofusicoccum ribis TaxID=45134 RepID=A0ABR3T0G7_9PEZI
MAQHHSTSAPAPRKVRSLVPADSWDSHMHVTSPDYPLAAAAAYTPSAHTLEDAMAFEHSYNIPNIVLVQPSIYGTDNACTLDALRTLGPHHGRAVVALDPSAPPPAATLRAWHEAGVRGVRLNLKSVGRLPSAAALRAELLAYAAAIRPLGSWALQVYLGLDAVPLLEPVVPDLGVKLVVDHLGHPALPEGGEVEPRRLEGWASLLRLVEAGSTWVKVSGAYRIEGEGRLEWVGAMARELLAVREGRRVVFATDWPHTRFEGVDVEPFVEKCVEWCDGDAEKVDRLFRANAEELWDVKR